MIRGIGLMAVAFLCLMSGGAQAETAARDQPMPMTSQQAVTTHASHRYCRTFFGCMVGRTYSRPRTNAFWTGRQVRNAGSWGGVSGRRTRQIVDWGNSKYKPGSIVIRTPERKLYYVLPGGKAMRYSVGVGREGFQWSGSSRIARKAVWPDWRPPRAMIERERRKGHYIPSYMPGGPGNPLGARALYIGGTLYRIHGTNDARTIGAAMSSGCIRMMNADVIDLYERARIGARVYVYQ